VAYNHSYYICIVTLYNNIQSPADLRLRRCGMARGSENIPLQRQRTITSANVVRTLHKMIFFCYNNKTSLCRRRSKSLLVPWICSCSGRFKNEKNDTYVTHNELPTFVVCISRYGRLHFILNISNCAIIISKKLYIPLYISLY